MDIKKLELLEQAIEPYLHLGFIVASQSEGAIILNYPPENYGDYLVDARKGNMVLSFL